MPACIRALRGISFADVLAVNARPNSYNQRMANEENTHHATDTEFVSGSMLLGENVVDLAAYCPNCGQVHGPLAVVVDYLNLLSSQGMFNWN